MHGSQEEHEAGTWPPGHPATGSRQDQTAAFMQHRDLLFAVAYNMLGSVTDAEDTLQETWLAWARARRDHVTSARAYLVRTTVREALRQLRARAARQESYVGPWLPEPLVTQADAARTTLRAEPVSMALLVVLETLSPLERAVFVLGDVFGYTHPEVATILGRSPAAIRQLAHRAREHVQARRPRYEPGPEARKRATERFLAAAAGGDIRALMDVLAPGVELWTDGGGQIPAAKRPIRGRDKVARVIATAGPRYLTGLEVRYLDINGGPGAVIFLGGSLYAAGALDLSPSGSWITGIYAVLNPAKLAPSVAPAARR